MASASSDRAGRVAAEAFVCRRRDGGLDLQRSTSVDAANNARDICGPSVDVATGDCAVVGSGGLDARIRAARNGADVCHLGGAVRVSEPDKPCGGQGRICDLDSFRAPGGGGHVDWGVGLAADGRVGTRRGRHKLAGSVQIMGFFSGQYIRP